MDDKAKQLCVLCCYLFGSGGDGDDDGIGMDLLGFCKQFVSESERLNNSPKVKIKVEEDGGGDEDNDEEVVFSKVLVELESIGGERGAGALLPTCPDCRGIMTEVTRRGGRVEEMEVKVRSLQLELLEQLKRLEKEVAEYWGEMRRMEEVVRRADVGCLEACLEGRETRREAGIVRAFRSQILKASAELQSFQNVLKRKILVSPTKSFPPSTPGRSRAKRAKVESTSPSKLVSTADSLSLDVKTEQDSIRNPTPGPSIKIESVEEDMDVHDMMPEVLIEENSPIDNFLDDDYDPASSCDTQDDSSDSDFSCLEELDKIPEGPSASAEIGDDPLFLESAASPPSTKKKKKKWKKKKKVSHISNAVIGMGDFKADVVKQVLRTKERKERQLSKSDKLAPSNDPTFLVEDPSQFYAVEYDFATGKIMVGHVEILLDEEKESLTCSACAYTLCVEKAYRKNAMLPTLFQHILGKHLEAYTCNQCGNVLTTRCRYKDHIRSHQMHFACEVCGKPLSSKGCLIFHKWNNHMSEEEIKLALARGEVDPREKLKRFKDKQKLLEHQCPTCGKAFQTGAHLKSHMETHMDPEQRKKFVCPMCGKSFVKQSWVSHQQNTCRPEGAPLLYCQECPKEKAGKGFASKQMLKRHVDRCHSTSSLERPFPCGICGKGFKFLGDVKKHEGRHTDARPYECGHGCGATFKEKKHCKRHEGTCKGAGAGWKGPRQRKPTEAGVAGVELPISYCTTNSSGK